MACLSKDDREDKRSEPSVVPKVRLPDSKLNATLERYLKRVGYWRLPPNWSFADWSHEIRAHSICTVCQAQSDYDPSRGVPLWAFVYQRVITRALTRYRQEWAYAYHNAPAIEETASDKTQDFDGAVVSS